MRLKILSLLSALLLVAACATDPEETGELIGCERVMAERAITPQLGALIDAVEREKATLIVAYTHGQPAQPTTFGHYLAAVTEVLIRDIEFTAAKFDEGGNKVANARATVRRYRIDYVLICPYLSESTIYRAETPKGFYSRLAGGKVPAWLQPITLPKDSPYKMWKVVG